MAIDAVTQAAAAAAGLTYYPAGYYTSINEFGAPLVPPGYIGEGFYSQPGLIYDPYGNTYTLPMKFVSSSFAMPTSAPSPAEATSAGAAFYAPPVAAAPSGAPAPSGASAPSGAPAPRGRAAAL